MSDDIRDLKKTIKELTVEIKRLSKRIALLEEDTGWKPKNRAKICPYCRGKGYIKNGHNPFDYRYPDYTNYMG